MLKVPTLFLGGFLTIAAGCASNPPVTEMTSSEREKIGEMIIFEPGALERGSYRIIGIVEGLACKRNLHARGSPSIAEAQQGVRIRAAEMGADAVANMLCQEKQEVDWGRNCWQTVICVGDAIAVTDQKLLVQARNAQGQRP